MRLKLSIFLVLTFISGCQSSLFIQPDVITGGINSNFVEEYPAYSSNGRYLAFASDRRGQRDIFLYDLKAKQLISLPNLNRGDSTQDQPDLSANGRYIAYVSAERGKTDIFVYDRQTQSSKLLTANIKGSCSQPTITGDGSQIAFQGSQLGQWKIFIIRLQNLDNEK
jgi:Tol biopolymer transport system component